MKRLLSIFICLLVLAPSLRAWTDDLSYRQALKKYHRHGEKYSWDTLHENIYWDVIYKSVEFREAYERKYAKDYKLGPEELQTRIQQAHTEAERGPEFFVIFTTYSKAWNDLDMKDSIWRLRLVVDDRMIEPVSIAKIKPTPLDASFYPFITPWARVYTVLFPAGALSSNSGDFKLSVFGVKGKQKLTWNLTK